MVGMDFLGPINPASANGSKYVLIVVDYFTRMTFAQDYVSADSAAVNDMWVSRLSPMLGWPTVLYCDNASYFTGLETRALLQSHGTQLITAPITHPASVGLVERTVQMIGGQLRKWVLARGARYMTHWASGLTPATININTRLMKIHGFSPAELMLGFNPVWNRTEFTQGGNEPFHEDNIGLVPGEHWAFLWEFRDEQRERMILSVVEAHNRTKTRSGRYTRPQEGDLVLVRRFQLDKDKGRKLESKWDGPRLLTTVTQGGVTGYVREVYGEGQGKKYHLDDLRTYVPRTNQQIQASTVTIARKAMENAPNVEQRAMDLPSLFV